MEEEKISLELDCSEEVSYLYYQAERLQKKTQPGQQNGFSFLRSVTIHNHTSQEYQNLRLHFDYEGLGDESLLRIEDKLIAVIPSESGFIIDDFTITINAKELYWLNDPIASQLIVSLLDENGEILAKQTVRLDFQPIRKSFKPGRLNEILVSYITPTDPRISKLAANAAKIFQEKYGSTYDLCGYLVNDSNYILKELDALYLAVQQLDIKYIMNPDTGNHYWYLRPPYEVIQNKVGCCIDISFLFASLCEAVGLHPVFISIAEKAGNHALVGVWLNDKTAGPACDENGSWLRYEADRSSENLAVIDVVGLTHASSTNFKNALDNGHERLEGAKNIIMALDVLSCRREGIQPIPVPNSDDTKEVKLDIIETGKADYLLPQIDESRHRFLPLDKKMPEDRVDHWERCLLDLNNSGRNHLINLPFGKRGVQLVVTDAQEFLDGLANREKMQIAFSGEMTKRILNRGEIIEFNALSDENLMEDGFRRNVLYCVDRGDDGDSYLKYLARSSNTNLEETGCNPLFLTLGVICWYENETSAKLGKGVIYSPIFLLPIRMPRRKTGSMYTFEYSLDDIQLNTTIFEYFRQNFHLDFSSLTIDSIQSKGEEGKVHIDAQVVFNTIKRIIAAAGLKNWKVKETPSVLGLFSFSHFAMWSDIQNRKSELKKHPIIRSFIDGSKIHPINEEVSVKDLDDAVPPTSMAIPLPADSSQIKAIYDAEHGESFILDGPPGTGKSQTIANMIVDLFYHNKKVLFVAEKEVALEVVKKRLVDLGLGDFCLQIADANTAKNLVLSQLDRLLKLGPKEQADKEEYAKKASQILDKRNELNGILKSIHGDSDYFLSVYEAILLSLYHKEGARSIEVPVSEEYVKNLTKEDFEKSLSILDQISDHDRAVSSYAYSPFRGYQNADYSILKTRALIAALTDIKEPLNAMKLDMETIQSKYKVFAKTLQNAKFLSKIFSELEKNSNVFFAYLGDENVYALSSVILERLGSYKTMYSLREEIEKDWKLEVIPKEEASPCLQTRLEETKALSFFKKRKEMKRIRKELKPFAKNKHALSSSGLTELASSLQHLTTFRSLQNYEGAKESRADAIIASCSPRTSNDYERLIEKFTRTFRLYEDVKQLQPASSYSLKDIASFFKTFAASDQQIFNPDFIRMSNHFAELNKAADSLRENHNFDYEEYANFDEVHKDNYDSNYNFFKEVEKCVAEICLDNGKIRTWCNLQADIELGKKVLPAELLDEYESGHISGSNLKDIYQYSLGNTITILALENKRMSNNRTLGSIDSKDTAREIAEYREYLNTFARLTVEETFARITANFPDSSQEYAETTRLFSLKKICASSARGMALRKILEEFSDIIQQMCPCFLMSPVSVAQYLDPKKYHFDVVIFDEASQIPTAEAIGALSRGDSCVIAGDKNQMPPSAFFKTSIDGSLEGADASYVLGNDLESLLEDAEALGFPKRSLNWHYRSHHESLIAFSNRRFYGNSLLTFPSPGSDGSAVSFRYISGNYVNNTNREEANAIVKEVLKRLKDPELSKRSIGIVTFNAPQQNLIEDLLDSALTKSNANSMPGGETIFVKNLENVQGDERDCILFSITYAPDKKTGKMSINFGPLTQQEKGARRLNVAVSRAREEMVVFSSVQPEEIPAERATYDGARRLKEFLSYAKHGITALPYLSSGYIQKEVPSVASFLAQDLRNKGYSVKTNLGVSTFKIDVAILDPRGSNRYILGIILDGESYTNTPTCRDRNIVQPQILKNLGWRIMRLWSVEYFDNASSCLNQIVEEVNRALHEEKTVEDNSLQHPSFTLNLQSKKTEHLRHKITYSRENTERAIFDPSTKEKIELGEYFRKIIAKEAPISLNLLEERFKERYSLTKMTASYRGFFQQGLERAGAYIEFCGPYRFYWPDSFACYSYSYYRVPVKGESRKITDISYNELGNAMRDILEDQGGEMAANVLYRQVNLLFGNEKLSTKTTSYLSNALRANLGERLGLKMSEDGTVSLFR